MYACYFGGHRTQIISQVAIDFRRVMCLDAFGTAFYTQLEAGKYSFYFSKLVQSTIAVALVIDLDLPLFKSGSQDVID